MTVLLPGLPRCETDVLVAASEQVGAQVRRVPPAGIPHVPEPAVARADRRDGGPSFLEKDPGWSLPQQPAAYCPAPFMETRLMSISRLPSFGVPDRAWKWPNLMLHCTLSKSYESSGCKARGVLLHLHLVRSPFISKIV